MKRFTSVAAGLILMLSGLGLAGCKEQVPQQDKAFQHTAENTHASIQKLREHLIKSVEDGDLQYVHDNMYYLQGLLEALSKDLQGERKEYVDQVLQKLYRISMAIDNSAGRGNKEATDANMQELIRLMDELQSYFHEQSK